MYYDADDLIKVLDAIKRTEVDSLKEDCDNQDFLTGVAFGMNFIIDRIIHSLRSQFSFRIIHCLLSQLSYRIIRCLLSQLRYRIIRCLLSQLR